MDAVRIEEIWKRFGKGAREVVALKDISFSIRKGEIFGLLGPNGAGKTTLISIMCGLLLKDSGKVSIAGFDLDADLLEIQKRINLVLGFTGIGMSLTVYEFLSYYCMLYGIENRKEKVKESAAAVGLEDKLDVLTLNLSSGYKQRLMLAKSLLNTPQILFLDEPTVGLDVDIAIKIRAVIKSLKDRGTTILLTTHNMYEVEELCDRIALISKGEIIAIGTVEQIKKMIKTEKVIEVEVDNLAAFSRNIARKRYVLSSNVHDDSVHVKVESYAHVKKVLFELSRSDHHIYSIKLLEPTLEDAFLELMRDHKKRDQKAERLSRMTLVKR